MGDRRRDWPWLVSLAVLAFTVRLLPLLTSGGLGFIGRYDDGVYYSAADALTFGRVPYRQFLLLHPPGILLVLAPFAALGRVTSDMAGMEVARLAFMAIGAINTVLVATLARRWGRTAMLVAGVVYACWQPAVYAEQSTFLEPVGGLLVLLGLRRLVNPHDRPTPRAEVVAGLCLGAAATVKIWYVAPLATVIAWQLVSRRPKSATRLLVAGVLAVSVIVVPFAALAGSRMDQLVIRDQLFRPMTVTSRLARVGGLLGVRSLTTGHLSLQRTLLAVLLAVFLVVVLVGLRDRAARPLVAVLAVNVVILMTAPVFLRHYSSFVAAPAAVLLGIAVAHLFRSAALRRAAPAVSLLLVAACAVSAIAIVRDDGGRAFPSKTFEAAAPPGCIAADDPLALAEVDRLSSDLRSGCRVDIDVSGALLDRYTVVYPDGVLVPRRDNPGWLAYLFGYLTHARAFIVSRQPSDGIFGPALRTYERYPLLVRGSDGHDEMRLGAS